MKKIWLFFLIALGWSDGIWLILIPSIQRKLGISLNPELVWVGLAGPGIAAIYLSIYYGKFNGLKNFLRPLMRWKVSPIYYVFVYFGVFLFYCAASWITVLWGSTSKIHDIYWLWANIKAPFFNLSGIWVLIEITIIYTFCEELGWRGFVLPRLAVHVNLVYAALIIGIFWTLWHVPLVYLGGSFFTIKSFVFYFLHIVSFSIMYAWLYFKTGSSLLLVGLFHGATDGIGSYFPLTVSTIGQGVNVCTLIGEMLVASLLTPYLWRYKFSKNSAAQHDLKEDAIL